MSKRTYFSQYESPNIVIVPTVSMEPPAKKIRLESDQRLETKTSADKIETCSSSHTPDKKNNVNGDCHLPINSVIEDVDNAVKEPIPSWATINHLSASQIHKNPLRLNVKENISTSQTLGIDSNVINKTINEHSGEKIRFTASNESDKEKKTYNSANNIKYNITRKPCQVKVDKFKTSVPGEKVKRKISDKHTKSTKKLKASDVNDLNKNSDSDFEEQKYRNTNTTSKKFKLEPHNVNENISKTDTKKTNKLINAKSHQKADKKCNNSNKDSAKIIPNKVSTVSNESKGSKIHRKQIPDYIKEKSEIVKKKHCDPDTNVKLKSTPKQDGPKPCLKDMTHSSKVTPMKSVVQVAKYFGLHTSKNQEQNDEAIDLRTKINRINQTNMEKLPKEIYSHSKHIKKKGQLNTRDNLRITVNNLNTQNDDKTKSKEKNKSPKCKSKRCKKIKLIINIICQKPLDGTLKTGSSDSDDGENDASYLLPDLSFLDDINVDEIVESLKQTKNETDTTDYFKDNMSLSSSDLYKWDSSMKNITESEKVKFVTKKDNFIVNENSSEVKFVNQTETNIKSLPNAITPNNQISSAKHTLAIPICETHTVPPIVDIKQELLANYCQQKEVETFNVNDIKKEDDEVSECSTVIIGELHSDFGEEIIEIVDDESSIEDRLQKIDSSETEAVAILHKEVDISAEKSNEQELINVLKQLTQVSNMAKQYDETPRQENNLVFDGNDDNNHKTVLPINDNPTEVHLVNNKETIVDNNEENLSAGLKLDTNQSQSNSKETVNISIIHNIGKDLLITNNIDISGEIALESNKDFRKIKAINKTTKDVFNNNSEWERRADENVTSEATRKAHTIPSTIKNDNNLLHVSNNNSKEINATTKTTKENNVLDNNTASELRDVENVTSESIGNIPSTINNDNNLLPIGSNTTSKEIIKAIMNLDDKCVNQCKTESCATVEPSVTETIGKKEITTSPVGPVSQEKMSFKSTKKQEYICDTRSVHLVKALSKQDKMLTVKLEERMCDYLKMQYSVLSVIKKGKFSKIYRCVDTNGQNYAVKILKSEHDRHVLGYDKEIMLMEIQKEVPRENLNCVYIFNGFSLNGYWCFLMEYYPKNLQQALQEYNKSFHIDVVQILAGQLIAAVTVLRNHNIVHSDIKPHHVLINSTHDRLKLCGFDSSYYIDTVQLLPNIGSPSYRAPEVILGFSAGFSVDVWSTALVMYEMSTGTRLLPGVYNNDILFKQMCTFGHMPLDMLEQSLYTDRHFIDNAFMRKYGYMGQNFTLIRTLKKTRDAHKNIMNSYHRHWGQYSTKHRRIMDTDKLGKFTKLLQQMLELDPRDRLTIEFAYANPFIYEIFM